jgi:hypothetical protein
MRWRGDGWNSSSCGWGSERYIHHYRQSDLMVVLLSDQGSLSFVLYGTGEKILKYLGSVDLA